MKSLVKKALGALLAATMLATASSSLVMAAGDVKAPTKAAGEDVIIVEAESLEGGSLGMKDATGMIAMAGGGSGHFTHGGDLKLPQGNYKLGIYMKIYKTQESVSDTTRILNWDMFYSAGGKEYFPSQKPFTQSDFETPGEFELFELPCVVETNDMSVIQCRMWTDNLVDVKIDKYVFIPEGSESEFPPIVQDKEEEEVPLPDGKVAVDTYDFPLSNDTLNFKMDGFGKPTGEILNGSINFSADKFLAGGVSGMKGFPEVNSNGTDLYLTSGEKIARFFVRMTDKVMGTGTRECMSLSVTANRFSQGVKSLKESDFKNMQNQTIVFDIPFTAMQGKAYNVSINWTGTKSMVVDKVQIVKAGDPVYAGSNKEVTGVASADGKKYTIDESVIDGMVAIDKVILKDGDAVMQIPLTAISEYMDGAKAIEIVSSDPDSATKSKLENAVSASALVDKMYSAKNFKAYIVKTDDSRSEITDFFSAIKVGFELSSAIKGEVGDNIDLAQVYYYDAENGAVTNLVSSPDTDKAYVLGDTKRVGTYLIGKAAVVERVYKPYDPKPELLRDDEVYDPNA